MLGVYGGGGESYELNAHSRQRRICLNLLCHHRVILSCFAQPLRSLNLVLGRRTPQLQYLAAGLLTGLFSYEV